MNTHEGKGKSILGPKNHYQSKGRDIQVGEDIIRTSSLGRQSSSGEG